MNPKTHCLLFEVRLVFGVELRQGHGTRGALRRTTNLPQDKWQANDWGQLLLCSTQEEHQPSDPNLSPSPPLAAPEVEAASVNSKFCVALRVPAELTTKADTPGGSAGVC